MVLLIAYTGFLCCRYYANQDNLAVAQVAPPPAPESTSDNYDDKLRLYRELWSNGQLERPDGTPLLLDGRRMTWATEREWRRSGRANQQLPPLTANGRTPMWTGLAQARYWVEEEYTRPDRVMTRPSTEPLRTTVSTNGPNHGWQSISAANADRRRLVVTNRVTRARNGRERRRAARERRRSSRASLRNQASP